MMSAKSTAASTPKRRTGCRVSSAATAAVLAAAAGRPGHILNLGHGVDRHTPVEAVAAMVETAKAARHVVAGTAAP